MGSKEKRHLTHDLIERVIALIREGNLEETLQEVEENPLLKRGSPIKGYSLLEAALLLNNFPLLQTLLRDKRLKPRKDILALSGHQYYYLPLRGPHEIALFVYACELGNQDICHFLLDHYFGASERRGLILAECLAEAAAGNRVEMVRWLVDHRADVNYNRGATPLIIAASCGANDAIRALLEMGSDIHLKSRGGSDALHTAVINRNKDTVRLLMEFGADPHNANKRPLREYPDFILSGSAWDAAQADGDPEMLAILGGGAVNSSPRKEHEAS